MSINFNLLLKRYQKTPTREVKRMIGVHVERIRHTCAHAAMVYFNLKHFIFSAKKKKKET